VNNFAHSWDDDYVENWKKVGVQWIKKQPHQPGNAIVLPVI